MADYGYGLTNTKSTLGMAVPRKFFPGFSCVEEVWHVHVLMAQGHVPPAAMKSAASVAAINYNRDNHCDTRLEYSGVIEDEWCMAEVSAWAAQNELFLAKNPLYEYQPFLNGSTTKSFRDKYQIFMALHNYESILPYLVAGFPLLEAKKMALAGVDLDLAKSVLEGS